MNDRMRSSAQSQSLPMSNTARVKPFSCTTPMSKCPEDKTAQTTRCFSLSPGNTARNTLFRSLSRVEPRKMRSVHTTTTRMSSLRVKTARSVYDPASCFSYRLTTSSSLKVRDKVSCCLLHLRFCCSVLSFELSESQLLKFCKICWDEHVSSLSAGT